DVDVLLLEGTRVTDGSEDGRSVLSETDLEAAFEERFRATKGLGIVLAAGQNLDRLVTIYRASRRAGRTLVVDLAAATVAPATRPWLTSRGSRPRSRRTLSSPCTRRLPGSFSVSSSARTCTATENGGRAELRRRRNRASDRAMDGPTQAVFARADVEEVHVL